MLNYDPDALPFQIEGTAIEASPGAIGVVFPVLLSCAPNCESLGISCHRREGKQRFRRRRALARRDGQARSEKEKRGLEGAGNASGVE